jgi:hypothetical protein
MLTRVDVKKILADSAKREILLRGAVAFIRSVERIGTEKDVVICPRCGREVHPWSLRRADVCSPDGWVYCIRTFEGIEAANARAAARAKAGGAA